jgi:hypothetical protein
VALADNLSGYGTVHLMDWMSSSRGQVRGLRGHIQIVDDESGVGFRARGANSANWLAQIKGPTETWHVFGCQIRAITEHREDAEALVDCWTVA